MGNPQKGWSACPHSSAEETCSGAWVSARQRKMLAKAGDCCTGESFEAAGRACLQRRIPLPCPPFTCEWAYK